MAFVQFSKISLAFGDNDILYEVSLNLAEGSRAALTGANGAGKTTLLKVIAGRQKADSGERSLQKGTKISYLPQSGIVHRGRTLKEEAETAFSESLQKLNRMEEIGIKLEKGKDNISESQIKSLLEEHRLLSEEIENSLYYRRNAVIGETLKGLGFKKSDETRNAEEFSGGWQMRIALAKALLENPDILLLDEPTNYLDIEARNWLEQWISGFKGGCLLVSHDRYFLDVCVNEVYELFRGNLKRYAGNYSSYEKTRQVELDSLIKSYNAQQEEIKKTENLITRFRYKASKASFAQELIKRLEKTERIEIPESFKKINITLPVPPHSGRIALTLENIGKSYGSKNVLNDLNLEIESGEKFLVAGRNGAGKSTLLRIIAGADRQYDGNIKYGAGIIPGYFSQDSAETLTGSVSVLEYLEDQSPLNLIPKLRDMLGAFLFRGDDVYKSLSVLSGGEKSRLALLQILLKPINLLVLDEPTNHLDLHSKDILLDCLKSYGGTVIFVSHDRAFMEALASKTLGLSGGEDSKRDHKLYYGGYAYYLERTEGETGSGNEANNKAIEASLSKEETIKIRAEQKQKQAFLRKLKREEETLLAEIEELEKEKTKTETELSTPAVYSNSEKAREVKRKLDEIVLLAEKKSAEWERKAEEIQNSSI